MKEAKRTPVPLPGAAAQSQPRSTPSKAPLSQEFVGSDDDDSPAESARKPRPAGKPKTTIAVHRPDGAAKAKPRATAKDSATASSAAKPQPLSKAASVSSSDDADDSAHESTSDSSSDSSSDESDESEPRQSARKPVAGQGPASQSQPHAVELRPAHVYVPPKGFNPVPVNEKTMSKSAHIFDNLEGKQIWHITAPAGVSMKDVKEMAMDRAMKGEAILDYKGTSYGFLRSEHGENTACEVMVPQQNGYKSVSSRVAQTLHLQTVVQLPQLSSKQAEANTGSEAAASITRSTIRAPRPQLKGLKMRFRPTGFGGGDLGTLGDSESEDETPRETAGLGMPNGLNLPSRIRKEKRKHVEVSGDARTELPAKKPKKHRTPEEAKRKDEARKARKERKRAQEAALAES